MNGWEEDVRELRLAEQDLARQSLEGRAERIRELEAEAKYLRRLVNELSAVPRPQPQAQRQESGPGVPAAGRPAGNVPRRWRVL